MQVMTTMTADQQEFAVRCWRDAGVDQAAIDAMLVGCPVHGNAGVDWDTEADEVYCQPCEQAKAGRS